MKIVIFIRHGIRQPEQENNLLFASPDNLNLEGHLLSFKLGKFITKKFGKPNIIYTDKQTNRTLDTTISLARGCKKKEIYVSDDNYFHPAIYPDLSLSTLSLYNDDINKIKNLLPDLNLNLDQIESLSSTIYYCQTCKIQHPLSRKKNKIGKIYNINWRLHYPENNRIESAAKSLLAGINSFSDFTVLVGHHHNLNVITQYLNKPFQVDRYPEYWVPANSGLIFIFHNDYIEIKILYLNRKNKFKIVQYTTVNNINDKYNFELAKKRISY